MSAVDVVLCFAPEMIPLYNPKVQLMMRRGPEKNIAVLFVYVMTKGT